MLLHKKPKRASLTLMEIDMSKLKQAVLKIIETEAEKISPVSLENRLIRLFKVKRYYVRKTVQSLLDEGEVVYTYHFGNSYLEKSFNRPVRVSNRVVLKPAHLFFEPTQDDVVVFLDHGVSFGTGQHPTTRLAIRAVEFLMSKTTSLLSKKDSLVLDIGTGSGVLALTALKFGVSHGIGTDIDPCARDEARKNAFLNDLNSRFAIYEGQLADLNPPVDLICANLRFPTLMNLSGQIDRLCATGGYAVFSGVRQDEFMEVLKRYAELGFRCIWKSIDQNWSGGAFSRTT